MKKYLLLLSISVVCCVGLVGQNVGSVNCILTKFQRVLLVTPDSTFNFTIFIEPNGKYGFGEGFYDSEFEDKKHVLHRLKKRNVVERDSFIFQFIPDIDTVNCVFPIDTFSYNELNWTQTLYRLNIAYVLKQFGQGKIKENEIRLLFPFLDNKSSYVLVNLSFFNDSVEISTICGNSIDYKGVQPFYSHNKLLKKRDVKNLKNKISKINAMQNIECLQYDSPWVLEFYNEGVYRSVIISNDCLRGRRDLRKLARFCFSILEMSNKCFNQTCSRK